MKTAFYTALERWHRLTPRQRRLLQASVVVLLVGIFAAYVWLPLMQSKARLKEQLPQLQASLAALARDAADVKRLTAQPVPSTAPTRRVLDAATARSLFGATATITVLEGGAMRIVTTDRAYAIWLDQLESLLAATQASVFSFSVKKIGTAQQVSTEVILTATKT